MQERRFGAAERDVAAIGQGTWYIEQAERAVAIAALRRGVDLGLNHIDTAEMYGSGQAETIVGEAIAGRREDVFLVSKVLPNNASRLGTRRACEASLKRLKTDRIDLYLLHWRGDIPLAETMAAFLALQEAGKIRHYGISNFDRSDMEELQSVKGGAGVAANQVLYNLERRGIEWDLLPWLRERGIPVMAYSPVAQGKLLRHRRLGEFARSHGMTAAQAALAWLLAKDDIIVIPKTGRRGGLEENLGALDHKLTAEALAELDRLFPPPDGPRALEMG
jgi:diketogulonate reductase-like aldo/keto reductase